MTLLRAISKPELLATREPRMRLLLRDSLLGLRHFWGPLVLQRRLDLFGVKTQALAFGDLVDEKGFTLLGGRIVDATDPETLFQMLRDLGRRVQIETTLTIGGSLSLMMDALIIRKTDDVDLVDEVPAAIRNEHALLDELTSKYGLKLAHFQSHYLPEGWARRVRSVGKFGKVTAFRVDPLDVLAGKLFSSRPKDFGDIRSAWQLIDRDAWRDRIARCTTAFRGEGKMLVAALHNWYILTGEEQLP